MKNVEDILGSLLHHLSLFSPDAKLCLPHCWIDHYSRFVMLFILTVVNDVEYAFGAHEFPTTGIFEVEPRKCPGFTFRTSIAVGSTELSPSDLCNLLNDMSTHYAGDSYNLLTKNCNHFTDELCLRLTGRPLPGWVNRLAGLGEFWPQIWWHPIYRKRLYVFQYTIFLNSFQIICTIF